MDNGFFGTTTLNCRYDMCIMLSAMLDTVMIDHDSECYSVLKEVNDVLWDSLPSVFEISFEE